MPEDVKPKDASSADTKEIDNLFEDFVNEVPEDADEGAEKEDEAADANADDEELDIEPIFLGKPTKVKKADAKGLLEKGMNYDHIKSKFDSAEAELAKLKSEIAARELADQRKQMEEKLTNEGYDAKVILDMIDSHPSIKRAEEIAKSVEAEKKEIERREFLAEQKKSLEKAPYYKELESEIDTIVKGNPQSDIFTVYDFLLGRKMRTGEIEELKKTASKAAAADLQDKMKRGGVITGDSEGEDSIDVAQVLDRQSMEMAKAFGHDPKSIARYVKDKIKRK